MTQLCQGKCEN